MEGGDTAMNHSSPAISLVSRRVMSSPVSVPVEQLRGLPRVQYLPEPLPRWFSHQEKTGQWRMGKNSSKVGNDLKTSKCQSMMGAKSKWFVLEQRGWTACLFNLCALCSSITTSSSLQCACREGSSYDESIYVMRVLQCVDERNVRLLNIYY